MAFAIEQGVPLLAVYDMPAAVAFYRDRLGFEVMQTSTPFTAAKDDYGWALLRTGSVELMLNTMYENNVRPSVRDAERTRAHGDTTIYFGCRDVEGAYASLQEKGVEVSAPKVAYYGLKQVYLKDPDGYTLCLQWRV